MKILIASSQVKGFLNKNITFSEKETEETISFDNLGECLKYLAEKKYFNCYPVTIDEKKEAVKKPAGKKTTVKKAVKKK